MRPRLFVSLTTIPPRMAGIGRCIASLLAQETPPEKVFVCVPERYRRFETPDPLPFDLALFGERVELVRCPRDEGPGTKILGALDQIPDDPDCLLVLVDDDMEYRPHMLTVLAETFRKSPGAAASFHTYHYRRLTVGQGADAFALPAHHLDGLRAYADMALTCPSAFYVDDLWISYFLWLKRIPIVDLSNRRGPDGIYAIYNDSRALNRESGVIGRKRVMRRTLWHLRRRFGWRETLRRLFRPSSG